MAKPKNPKVFAYRRENGRVGIRNHVVILPLDDLSNAACEKVAYNVKGTKAIPHAYGRLQFGEDLELFFRTMIGTGANPNVAAVVVIGIEPDWTNRIVEGIAKTGKPVAGFSIERFGEFKTVEMACWKAKEYVQWASELRREPVDLKEIWVSVKCGESDTTSGLASNPTVGNAIEKLVAMGATTSFGETSEITGAEMVCQRARGHPEDRREVHGHLQRLPEDDRRQQDRRPLRLPADQGQHPRRADHHRGEGLRQPAEDRQEGEVRRACWTRPRRPPSRGCGSWTPPAPRPRP